MQKKITARNLVRLSLKTIAVLGQGENPSDEEAQDGLYNLNEIINMWNTEQLMIFSNSTIYVPLTGKESYLVGEGGDVLTRPSFGIFNAYYVKNNYSSKLNILTSQQYDDINYKNYTADTPSSIYYNATYPLGELYVYPASSEGRIVLTVSSQFEGFDTLDEEIDLPEEYIRALRLNLAIDLSHYYKVEASASMIEQAVGAKAKIKVKNSSEKLMTMTCNDFIRSGRRFDILMGE